MRPPSAAIQQGRVMRAAVPGELRPCSTLFDRVPQKVMARRFELDFTWPEVLALARWCGGAAFFSDPEPDNRDRWFIVPPTAMTLYRGQWIFKVLSGEHEGRWFTLFDDSFREIYREA